MKIRQKKKIDESVQKAKALGKYWQIFPGAGAGQLA